MLAAPWGDPSRWVLARYRVGGYLGESFTSLRVLYEWLEPSGVVVYASDTLVEHVSRPVIAGNIGAGYGASVVGPVGEWVGGYACGLPVDTVILPGVIGKEDVRVEGSPRDYYYLMLYDLVRRIVYDGGFDGIALDTTHGVNYMASMSLQAAREAAAILGVFHGGKAVLEVYNSSPVVPDKAAREACGRSDSDPCMPRDPEACQSVMMEALIHRVLREELGGSFLVSELDVLVSQVRGETPRPISGTGLGDSGVRARVDRAFKDTMEEVRDALLVVRLARYGLVPELVYKLSSLGSPTVRFQEAIDRVLDAWASAIHVDTLGDNVFITRGARLGEGFRLLVYALAISALYERLEDPGEPTLGRAWSLAEKLYDKDSIMGVVQAREKEKLARKLRKLIEKSSGEVTGWIPMNLIHREDRDRCRELGDCRVFKRDLLAHGGWHSCVVEVKPEYGVDGSLDFEATRYRIREDGVCKMNNEVPDVWRAVTRV